LNSNIPRYDGGWTIGWLRIHNDRIRSFLVSQIHSINQADAVCAASAKLGQACSHNHQAGAEYEQT
jgi:hypothetical protein